MDDKGRAVYMPFSVTCLYYKVNSDLKGTPSWVVYKGRFDKILGRSATAYGGLFDAADCHGGMSMP
eukprot:5490667-Amphidinium_carterae.2